MKKSLIATSAAAVALAAMPMAGVFAADDTQVVDTIQVTVDSACTFNAEQSASMSDTTYSATVKNGAEASFNNSGAHKFNVMCNNNSGYNVTATATPLTGGTVSTNTIPYTASYVNSGANGDWSATVAAGTNNASAVTTGAITSGSVIVTQNAATASTDFTVTYKAYVGTTTPADTYTGTMTYDLAQL